MEKPGAVLSEKWYGTQYQELHFSANTLAALKQASANDKSVLTPPRVNPYMPENFAMLEPKVAHPSPNPSPNPNPNPQP